MTNIDFDQLIKIYNDTTFGEDDQLNGEDDRLKVVTISSQSVLDTLISIDNDDDLAEKAGIFVKSDISAETAIGANVDVSINSPKVGLGVLAATFDKMLISNNAYFEEPPNYFIYKTGVFKKQQLSNKIIQNYRFVLRFVQDLKNAADYVDGINDELIFIDDAKFILRVKYSEDTLDKLDASSLELLLDVLDDKVHRTEKLTLLANSIKKISRAEDRDVKFSFLLKNIELILAEVKNGHKLYISNFSYSKIKDEIEDAKIEYINRIHKTLVSLQSQVLAIPIATIVVSTQLKESNAENFTYWTNTSLIVGAWIFVLLLVLSVINQWQNLNSIATEIGRQQRQFREDYEAISREFLPEFTKLGGRIRYQQMILIVIIIIAVAGVGFVTYAYNSLTEYSFINQLWCWLSDKF